MTRPKHHLLAAVALACLAALGASTGALAQVPPAGPPAEAAAPAAYTAAELETLVAPFALYPDDLVAIILPASTFPLQVVQADRFLEKRKSNPKLEIEAGWDDSVKALVNYPEVVKKMSSDLDWTEALGEAVVSNNDAVMEAVQAFRRKAQTAGNLKSNEKQNVVVEQQVIKIEPADPQVIYVPQYEPTQVVVAGAAPYYYPYSPPYPVYYYPYAPGAALATGIIWGAAMGAIWSGGHYVSHYGGGGNNNININRGDVNIGSGNVNRGDRGGGGGGGRGGGSSTWKPTKQPGQVGSAGNRGTGNRVGDRSSTGAMGAGAANRPSPGGGAGAGGRTGGASASTRPAGGGGGGAFGGMDSGSSASRASARGTESRGSAGASRPSPSTGARSAPSGGGARAGGGGGAPRGGGGGGRGGGGGGRGGGRR